MAGDVESNITLANLDEAVKRGMELHRGTEGGEPGKQKKVLHRAGVTSDQYDGDDVVEERSDRWFRSRARAAPGVPSSAARSL